MSVMHSCTPKIVILHVLNDLGQGMFASNYDRIKFLHCMYVFAGIGILQVFLYLIIMYYISSSIYNYILPYLGPTYFILPFEFYSNTVLSCSLLYHSVFVFIN